MSTLLGQQFQFEPHGGFGHNDPDGEPWPFGYISTSPTPQPVFELNVILGFDDAELRSLALKMAAAQEMFEALDHIGGLSRALRHGGPDPMDLQGLSEALEEAVNLANSLVSSLEPA